METLDEYLGERLSDPEFRAAWDALEKPHELLWAYIDRVLRPVCPDCLCDLVKGVIPVPVSAMFPRGVATVSLCGCQPSEKAEMIAKMGNT